MERICSYGGVPINKYATILYLAWIVGLTIYGIYVLATN
jgi:hypothetical protein